MRGHSSYRLCDPCVPCERLRDTFVYRCYGAVPRVCPARRFEPAGRNWVSPNIASRRYAARP